MKKTYYLILILTSVGNVFGQEKPNLQRIYDEQRADAIKRGLIADPKVIEELSGGPVDKGRAVKLYDAYPDLPGKTYDNYKGNTLDENKINVTESKIIEKTNANLNVDNSENQNSEKGIELYDNYPDLPGNYYDKYKGYIDENTLKGGQFSTYELDKLLKEAKRKEMNNIIISLIVIALLIIITFIVIGSFKKNKAKSSKTTTPVIPNEKTVELFVDEKLNLDSLNNKTTDFDLIEKIEQLNNLKIKGAITETEFQELKKRIIN